jgi:hypothetical protein
LVGTDYEDKPVPRTEEMVPVFRRLYEACMERGLPIGCAPNVHVSLVMLPEEAAWLSDRRFPFQDIKRGLLSRAVAFQLGRRLRRAERRAA